MQKYQKLGNDLSGLKILADAERGFLITGDGYLDGRRVYINTNKGLLGKEKDGSPKLAPDFKGKLLPCRNLDLNTMVTTDMPVIVMPENMFTRSLIEFGLPVPQVIFLDSEENRRKAAPLTGDCFEDAITGEDSIVKVSGLIPENEEKFNTWLENNGMKLLPGPNTLLKRGAIWVTDNPELAEYLDGFSAKTISVYCQPTQLMNAWTEQFTVVEDSPSKNGKFTIAKEAWKALLDSGDFDPRVTILKVAGAEDSYFLKAQAIMGQASEIAIGNFKYREGLNIGDTITLTNTNMGIHQTELPSCRKGSNLSTMELKFLGVKEAAPYQVLRKKVVRAIQHFLDGDPDTVEEMLSIKAGDDDLEIRNSIAKYWAADVEPDHPRYCEMRKRYASFFIPDRVNKLFVPDSIRAKLIINEDLVAGECLVPQYTFSKNETSLVGKAQETVVPGMVVGGSRMPTLHRTGIRRLEAIGYSSLNAIEISAEDAEAMQGDEDGDDIKLDLLLQGTREPFPFVFDKLPKPPMSLFASQCDIHKAATTIGIASNLSSKICLKHCIDQDQSEDAIALEKEAAWCYHNSIGGLKHWAEDPNELIKKHGVKFESEIDRLMDLIAKKWNKNNIRKTVTVEERIFTAEQVISNRKEREIRNPLELIADDLAELTLPVANPLKFQNRLAALQATHFGLDTSNIKHVANLARSINNDIVEAWKVYIINPLEKKQDPDIKEFDKTIFRLRDQLFTPEEKALQFCMFTHMTASWKSSAITDRVAGIEELHIAYKEKEAISLDEHIVL